MLPSTGPRQHLNPWTVHCSSGEAGHTAPALSTRVLICHSVKATPPPSFVPMTGCLSLFLQPAQPGSHSTVNWVSFWYLPRPILPSMPQLCICSDFTSPFLIQLHLQNKVSGGTPLWLSSRLFLCPQALAFSGCLKPAGLPPLPASEASITGCGNLNP